MLFSILILSSCDKPVETMNPNSSNVIESGLPRPDELPSASATTSPSLEPTLTSTPIQQRPSAYTKSEYFIFDETTGTITGYIGEGGQYVSIPKSINEVSVTQIGMYAFAQIDLYGVIIPEGVIEIQEGAFYYSFLEEVEIPKSVKIIAERAFSENNLVNIILPIDLEYLGAEAFAGNKLTQVIIPETLSEISAKAFSINELTSVIIPDNITSIGEYAFRKNKLTSISLPTDLKKICKGSFRENKLSEIVIPKQVEIIDEYAFYENMLKDITIPDRVEVIGKYAFANNNIANITLGASLMEMGEYAFSNNKIKQLNIVIGLSKISKGCFLNNELEDLLLPDNIIEVNNYAFQNNNISKLKLSQNLKIIDSNAFSDNKLTQIAVHESTEMIMDKAFAENEIKSVLVEGNVIYIAEDAFDNIGGMKAVCVKNSYPDYYFSKKMVEISYYPDKSINASVPANRSDIISKGIFMQSEEESFNFMENWIREYLISRYGETCKLKTYIKLVDKDIKDEFISPDNIVYINEYSVIFEYQAEHGLQKKDVSLQAVLVKTNGFLYYLSGIEEAHIDFNDKDVLYRYLLDDYRFEYFAISDNNSTYIVSKDIEKSDYFPDYLTNLEDTINMKFANTDYILIESSNSIYLKNLKTNEIIVKQQRLDNIQNFRYKVLDVLDDQRYVYAKLGNSGYQGIYVYNIKNNTNVQLYFQEYDFYMIPIYVHGGHIIVAHGDDHSLRIESLFKLDISEIDTGRLTKLSNDTIHLREFVISPNSKYMVYVASPAYAEGVHLEGVKYFISNKKAYYTRNIKVIDTSTGEVLKGGTIFESADKYDDVNNRYTYENLEFAFKDFKVYMKYRDVYFDIDIYE